MKTEIKNLSLNEMANTRNTWAIIAFDETNNWRDDIAKKAKKIEGVYMVNLKEPTHLCELAISYPAIFLRSYFHNVDKFDMDGEDAMLEYENGGDDFSYFSGSSVPKFIRYYKKGSEDEVRENESANPSYC